jgi:predicted site-specific integrase-resolvase
LAIELKSRLSPRELATHLGVTIQTLENWRMDGKGPAYIKLSPGPKGHVRYKIEDVLDWEDNLTRIDPSTQRRALEEAERVA